MDLMPHDPQHVERFEKNKPSERAGRKATCLSPQGERREMASGLPSPCDASRARFLRANEVYWRWQHERTSIKKR